jgi:hypothetical protein
LQIKVGNRELKEVIILNSDNQGLWVGTWTGAGAWLLYKGN